MATKIPSMTFTDFSLAGLDFFLTHESAKFAKGRKPDSFESHNSLKLSFTNIRDLHLNFAECETFRDSNSPAIVALCETNLDDSCNYDWLSSFNPKRFCFSYVWSCSLFERTSFCTVLMPRKLCGFFLMFSTDFTSFSV